MKADLIGLDSVLMHKEHDELISLGFTQRKWSVYTYENGNICIKDFDIYLNDKKIFEYDIEIIRKLLNLRYSKQKQVK